MCKDCKANTWWWFWIYLLGLYQCTQAIHRSYLGLIDWIDMKNTLRQICCSKLCLDFEWSYMNFIQVDRSPSLIFHIIVLDCMKSGKIYWNTWMCSSQILEGHNICPFGLHQLVGQCLIHCDDNTILALCSGHMPLPQYNSVQLIKCFAGVKIVKPILIMLCAFSGWWFLRFSSLPYCPLHLVT